MEVIGANAFNSCDELTTVTMSSNLKRLGEYAFASCPKLTQISLPGTLDMVPSHCFAYDTLLKNVTLGEGIREIADNAFFLCGAEMVRLPNSLEKIHAYGFKASNIREITIPTGITEIYEHTFDGCGKLKSVTLPYSIKQIHYHAFFSCEALERVVLPGYLSSIHSDAFLGCESLEYIVALNRNTVFTNRITNMYQTIVGYENSTAQEYAQTYGNKFLPISFYDVMPWEWYYDAVQYAADNSLMYGVNTAQFDPEGLTNRAMLVTVLWRYAGEAKEGENQFTDVETSQWYADAVAWASYHGIVSGVGDNRFAPEDTITREQMTAILFRYCNGLGIDTRKRASLQDFPDANKVSTWAEDAISWAVAEGIISGSKEGEHTYLNPDGGTTRAQMASILMRFIQNVLPQ